MNAIATVPQRRFAGMFVRRERWTLSRRARLIGLVSCIGAAFAAVHFAYPFLAVTKRSNAEYLVVESWIPRYALQESVALYEKGGYRKVFTSGCPKADDLGGAVKVSSAEAAMTVMERFGLNHDSGTAVSCWVERKDRTYNSALAVKEWFQKNGIAVEAIDVVTLGPHARRSRLLYQKAFGGKVKVGIIAVEDRSYDPAHWWRSSEGVRDIVGEGVAYVYARIFFHPSYSNLDDNGQNDTNSRTNGGILPAAAGVRAEATANVSTGQGASDYR